VPDGVCRDLPGRQQGKAERPAVAPDWHVREVDNLARQIAEPPKPLKEATVFDRRSSRQPCHSADIFDQGGLPKRLLLLSMPPFLLPVPPLPTRAKLLRHPVEPRLQIGWVNGPQG